MKKKKKIIIIVLSAVVAAAAILAIIYFTCLNPYRDTVDSFETTLALDTVLTEEEAREDLEYMISKLRTHHPAWLEADCTLDDDADARYEATLASLDGDITVRDLWSIACEVISGMHDGHTWVLAAYDETLYIDSFDQVYEYGIPYAIDGIPYEDIYNRFLELVSYERTEYADRSFRSGIMLAEHWLQLLGIDTSDGVTFTYIIDGEEQNYHYGFEALQSEDSDDSDTVYDWVYYTIDVENNLGIFTLESCDNNSHYDEVLAAFWAEVFANNIDNVVVDLRGNGGGSSNVANKFISYLNVDDYNSWQCKIRYGWFLLSFNDTLQKNKKQAETFDGNVYVLTDVRTFSSAMDFAMLIKDNDLGVLVGEASGNMPNSYGDCLYFQLPNSKLKMSVSFKKWYRVNLDKCDEPLYTDYETDSADALNKVYELIQAE